MSSNIFSTPRHRSDKPKYIIMMTNEGSTKSVNFMTPRAGVLMLGRGHVSHFSKYVLSSTLSINIQHVDFYCVGIMMLLSNTIVDFLISFIL